MNDFARNANDDRDLLRCYAEADAGAEDAFRQLVERYSGLVYGTTMRRLANPEWASDATQNVFAALAAKAPALARDDIPSVGAWLHRAATFESKRVQRDQLRAQQRQAMIREELSAVSGDASTWNEIRPALDEALQKLPERDRDILVLHYFDGIKFRDIANRLGIGADAAQKRSARALEKLARLLRSRSAAVSSMLLATGLSSELARSAPSALVAKISAATNETAATTALLTAMSATNKTTIISTAVAALAILAASVGAGYLIGDTTRPAVPDQTGSQSDSISSSAPIGESDDIDPGEIAPAAGAADRFIAEIKHLMAERKRLMEEGKELQSAGVPEQELDEVFVKMELLEQRAYRVADTLSADDIGTVLEFLDSQGAQDMKHIGQRLVLSSWGKRDPLAALEFASVHIPGGESHVFNGWGQSDPTAALRKQQELAAADRQVGRQTLSGLYEGWLSVDPAAAIAALEDLEFDEQKALYRAFGHLTRRPSTRAKLLEAIPRIADENLRAELVREVGGDWAEFSPTQTFAWFDTIEFQNPRIALAAMNIIFSSATKRGGDMATAADWIWPHLPPDQRPSFLERNINGAWKLSDPEAVSAWLAKHEISTGKP